MAYRPLSFADVVGQGHVVGLLRAMSARYRAGEAKWPPALVFYGPRGTGKTTMARIVSSALNCTGYSDPEDGEAEGHGREAGEPCLDCPSCLAIRKGTSAGVTELDMASHGSVEDVRSIRDQASFSMAENYRVYLLDEVHSASKEAFNALLKILEEPPPRVLFVLITTEPERIPDTIRSRAMEFEFRRMSPADIVSRLRSIAESQDVAGRIDESVYPVLASRARGGMRDAVMSLEQVCYVEGSVTTETVRRVFGVSDLPERLLDAAVKGDASRGLAAVQEAALAAVPVPVLVSAMLEGLSALLASAQGAEPIAGSVSAEWLEAYAHGIPPSAIVAGIRVLWDIQSRVRTTDASSTATFAAGYALFVQAVSPGAWAQSAREANSGPVMSVPVSYPIPANGGAQSPAGANGMSVPGVPSPRALSPEEVADLVLKLQAPSADSDSKPGI